MHLVFSRLENRSCKKHLAIDWLAAVAGEWKWKMLAGWHRKGMCRRPESVGLWAAVRPSRKQRCRLLENVHIVFSRLKNSRLLFFCLPAEFCSAAFGSRCGIPWKDQTEEIKKSGKILLQWRKIWHTVYIRNEEDFRWTII